MNLSTHRSSPRLVALLALLAGCAHRGPSPLLTLRRVVLNQSGSGYFERTGRVTGDRLALRLKSHEVDDVLATLTVLEQGSNPGQTVVAAGVPHATGGREDTVNLDLRLPDTRPRDLMVSYAVPTANWQATYRVVLPEREGSPALLQIWALVHNSSDEDWNRVEMTLATGAPLSFAFHLRTPSFTARPDATGTLHTPVVNGPVTSEQSRNEEAQRRLATDRERGRFTDELRAQGGGHRGGEDDGDGRRAGDTDHDGVPDVSDRCPNEAETYNGQRDDDGCPDSAQVTLSQSQIRILQNVYFDAGSNALQTRGLPVLDAVAQAVRANPQLRVVEVQGNASEDEPSGWALALSRAAAVRARLVALGVDGDRLRVRSFGSTHPAVPNTTPENRQRNRYVGFHVVSEPAEPTSVTGATQEGAGRGSVTAQGLSASSGPNASTHEFAGATRFVVSAPVSIAAGSAALVTIASREVPGEDVYLYRPESAAPASRQHPYRAARLRNRTGMTLLPGPVALFSGGTFAGEGLLQRLHDDETTFVPYAIDPSTTVTTAVEEAREPRRVVSVLRSMVTLEDTSVRRTRYRVDPGAQSPSRVYLRHPHVAGYTARNLPPETEAGREADLVPVPLTPRRESTLSVEQVRPVRRSLSLVDDVATDLAPYLAASPDALRQQLRAVLEQRASLARSEREADELREQLSDVAVRNAEIRETLRSLQSVTDAARVELRTRLTRQLQESMTRHDALSRDLAARTAAAAARRTQLIDALRGMRVDEEPAPAPAAAAAAHAR